MLGASGYTFNPLWDMNAMFGVDAQGISELKLVPGGLWNVPCVGAKGFGFDFDNKGCEPRGCLTAGR